MQKTTYREKLAKKSQNNSKDTQILKMQTTYDDMLKKKKIAEFLGLEANGPWEIVCESQDQNLVMVHYADNADTNIFGALRGVVVDMNKGNVVCYSYPHATTVTASQLNVVDDDLQLFVENTQNKENTEIKLKMENIKIKMGFEGTLIHIFKHNGTVYHVTRKRLDPSKSRWGNSKTFGEIYTELNGPSDESFFDVNKKYSPYCHTFILSHPDLLVATKCNVGKGFLVYLGPKQMYSVDDSCPYPLDEVDVELKIPSTVSTEESRDESNGSSSNTYFHPPILSLEEANKHLLFGFYEPFENSDKMDQRLLPGEFIILEDHSTRLMYRIESPAYQWRSTLRNNNPNLLHRFFELLDTLNENKNKNSQTNQITQITFPELTMYKLDSLQQAVEAGPLIMWPQTYGASVPEVREAKLYNIWQNFLISVPLHRQPEVVKYYEFYMTRKNDVAEWLCQLSSNPSFRSLESLSTFSKRVQDILVKTRTFAEDRVKKGNNIDPKTRQKKGVEFWTQVNIKNFINKELGSSLYRLIKEMDKCKESSHKETQTENPNVEVKNE